MSKKKETEKVRKTIKRGSVVSLSPEVAIQFIDEYIEVDSDESNRSSLYVVVVSETDKLGMSNQVTCIKLSDVKLVTVPLEFVSQVHEIHNTSGE